MNHPRTDALLAGLAARMPMHRKFLDSAVSGLTAGERAELETYLDYLIGDGQSPEAILDCYETILADTMDAQRHFLVHGTYPHQSFAAVADKVYFSPDYMTRYMVGLALTAFLWPNHVAIRRFYDEVLEAIDGGGNYLEVGPGHGFFLLSAMRKECFERHLGIDISATSLALTERAVTHYLPALRPRLELRETDFLAAGQIEGPFNMIVMGEVLEHVETPERFLRRIAEIAHADTHIFVSTCVNAPAIDHIYLFSSLQAVESMIAAAGLTVERRLAAPHPGKSLAACEAQRLPINVAYLLRTA